MANRISALHGHKQTGRYGRSGDTGIFLTEVSNLMLYQIAAWPETIEQVGQQAAKLVGVPHAPAPGKAVSGTTASLLRVEPLKWWLEGAAATPMDAESGSVLDLSHSRTRVQITGDEATSLLNRHLPLDLREENFPLGSVASTAYHHVGVTLWRSEQGYQLFLPRGFALSLWQGLFDSALQFGVEVT